MELSLDSRALVVCNLVTVHSLELVVRQVLLGNPDMEHDLVQVDNPVLRAFNRAMEHSLDMELNLELAGRQDNPATELSRELVLGNLVMEVSLELVVFSPDTELNQELAHRQELVQDSLATASPVMVASQELEASLELEVKLELVEVRLGTEHSRALEVNTFMVPNQE